VVNFEVPETFHNAHFTLTDQVGTTLVNQVLSSNTFRFEKGQLPQGLYFFTLVGDKGAVLTGKIVLE
jgi:hypothetical protein